DRANAVVAQMLLHLRDQIAAVRARDAYGRVDVGEPVRDDGVDHDALDLEQLAGLSAVRRHVSSAPVLVRVQSRPGARRGEAAPAGCAGGAKREVREGSAAQW